jgi:hypothetical protein
MSIKDVGGHPDEDFPKIIFKLRLKLKLIEKGERNIEQQKKYRKKANKSFGLKSVIGRKIPSK